MLCPCWTKLTDMLTITVDRVLKCASHFLSAAHSVTHFISTTLWDANCCWAPFIDEETESQKGEVVCSVNEEGHQALPLCCCSLAQSRPTLWDPTDCSTPGFPVLHDHPEFAQTLLHWISDAISSSVAPSPPALCPLALYQSTCDCPHAQPTEQQSVCSH